MDRKIDRYINMQKQKQKYRNIDRLIYEGQKESVLADKT